LGDTIYFLEEGEIPGLYIVQHIPSTFDWKAAGLTVVQQTKPLFSTDSHFEVTISISAKVMTPSGSGRSHGTQASLFDIWIQESE
jgi:hypothetical protein